MKKLLIYILFASAFVSCAKKAQLPIEPMYGITYRAWLAKKDPQAKPIAEGSDIYIHYYKHGTPIENLHPEPNVSWIYMSYTGYTTDDRIFVTRDSTHSRLLGKWLINTHWCDDYIQMSSPDNTKLCPGFLEVLPKLYPGDSARIYFPANKSYASNFATTAPYKGEELSYADKPVYFDVRIGSVVNYSPTTFEMDSVASLAKLNFGQALKDSVAPGIFMKKTLEYPKGDTITKDSTVSLYYAQYFTDGFLVQTNWDSIAKARGRYKEAATPAEQRAAYKILQYSNTKSPNIPQAITKTLMKMRKGEHARVYSLSYWAKSSNGGNIMTATALEVEVLNYQPMMFDIYTFKKDSISPM
ncbi:MAG: hypothetical protein RR329_08200 [Mucinivorans sp.]